MDTRTDQATTSDSPANRPYALIVHIGEAPTDDGARLVDVTPQEAAPDATEHPTVIALRVAGLTPSDVRSRVLVHIDPAVEPLTAVSTYAAVCAYAARRLDVRIGQEDVLDAPAIDTLSRSLPDLGKPQSAFEVVQVGVAHDVIPYIVGSVGPQEAQMIRYAKRCRLVLFPEPGAAIAQFVAVSALRSRGDQDRFPLLISDPNAPLDSETEGVDLDSIRRQAVDVRRHSRVDDRSALAPRGPLSERSKDLLMAAAVAVEATMVALGSTTPGNGVWHCPRPHRHTHGDAIPSMRVESARARCFRCDPEWVDSLRLTADVKGCSFDEAAAWLTAIVAPRSEQLIDAVRDRLTKTTSVTSDASDISDTAAAE